MSWVADLAVWMLMPLAGGCGAWARFRADQTIQSLLSGISENAAHSSTRWRVGAALPIFLINLTGCFLAGLLYHPLGYYSAVWLVVATGFLGGWTTFSTAMMDIYMLLAAKKLAGVIGAFVFAWLTLLTCVAAARVGMQLT